MTFPKQQYRKKIIAMAVTLFRQKKSIEAAVKIVKPDSESEKDGDDVPLSNLVAKKMFFRNGINVLKSQH